MHIKLLIICLFAITIGTVAYAAQSVNDRIEIDNDDANITLAAGDLFGYQIEAIGDLDSDGVIDLAVIKFADNTGEADAGSILILFINAICSIEPLSTLVVPAAIHPAKLPTELTITISFVPLTEPLAFINKIKIEPASASPVLSANFITAKSITPSESKSPIASI